MNELNNIFAHHRKKYYGFNLMRSIARSDAIWRVFFSIFEVSSNPLEYDRQFMILLPNGCLPAHGGESEREY